LAEAALESYGLRGAGLSLLGDPGFKDVFRVSSAGHGDFVLRMYDVPVVAEDAVRSDEALRTGAGLRSAETLRFQLLWLRMLRKETSLILPEPVPTARGELVGHVSALDAPANYPFVSRLSRPLVLRWRARRGKEDPGRNFVLLRWVPGEPGGEQDPRGLFGMGAYVARLHRHGEESPVPESLALPRWD
jgi:Ser/Thr protein kinase RdoA (MazF antagonist)